MEKDCNQQYIPPPIILPLPRGLAQVTDCQLPSMEGGSSYRSQIGVDLASGVRFVSLFKVGRCYDKFMVSTCCRERAKCATTAPPTAKKQRSARSLANTMSAAT